MKIHYLLLSVKMNGLLLTIKPTRNYEENNYIYCNIIAIFEKDYIGYLYLEENILYWSQDKKSEFLLLTFIFVNAFFI